METGGRGCCQSVGLGLNTHLGQEIDFVSPQLGNVELRHASKAGAWSIPLDEG